MDNQTPFFKPYKAEKFRLFAIYRQMPPMCRSDKLKKEQDELSSIRCMSDFSRKFKVCKDTLTDWGKIIDKMPPITAEVEEMIKNYESYKKRFGFR